MIKLKIVLVPAETTGIFHAKEDFLKDWFEDLNKYVADEEPASLEDETPPEQ